MVVRKFQNLLKKSTLSCAYVSFNAHRNWHISVVELNAVTSRLSMRKTHIPLQYLTVAYNAVDMLTLIGHGLL